MQNFRRVTVEPALENFFIEANIIDQKGRSEGLGKVLAVAELGEGAGFGGHHHAFKIFFLLLDLCGLPVLIFGKVFERQELIDTREFGTADETQRQKSSQNFFNGSQLFARESSFFLMAVGVQNFEPLQDVRID